MNGSGKTAQGKLGVLSENKAKLLRLFAKQAAARGNAITALTRDPASGKFQVPTSWAQQRLWFIDQLEGGGAGYLIPTTIRLRGPLDQMALKSALDTIVQRHEVLRTVFVVVDGTPSQDIASGGSFRLERIDLARIGNPERDEEVRRQRAEEALTPFDLSTGPLIRGRLLRIEPQEHLLLITMHHIISDGWSMGVFVREMSDLYSSHCGERHTSLTPLTLQYSDYAHWQQEWLRGEVLQKQLEYWRETLRGPLPVTELPTDRPRPNTQSYRGRNLPVLVDAGLTSDLRAFAQRHELTLFMVLYAAWSILLARLTGQSDVIVGTPIANRQRPELESLIGFFVNTLALRVEVHNQLPLDQFLRQVKEVTLGAYGHQDVPFEKVVEAVQPARTLSRNPIFQVMLALQNTPRADLNMTGLQATFEQPVDEPSIFDLFLSLDERDGELTGTLNYATDLFDEATVERWFACFSLLLRELVQRVDSNVGDLSLLPAAERTQVLKHFNATQMAVGVEQRVHELFESQVRQTPDAIAVMHGDQHISFAQLNAKANQLARYLVNLGVGTDEVVGICVSRGVPMVLGVLAILKAGAAYLPLDPNYPPDRLRHMLEDAAPRVVLTQEALQAGLPATQAELVLLDPTLEQLTGHLDENLPLPGRAEDLVYLIYTSGSTGRPKGTAMPHRAMVNLIQWHRQTLGDTVGQRVLQFAALSFDVAFQEIFTTLCTGGTLVMLDEWVRRDVPALMQLLNAQRIHRLFVPPLMLQTLAEYAASRGTVPSDLRDVITAGEQLKVSAEIIGFFEQLPGCRLHNHYGPTETHVVTALTLEGNPKQWPVLPSIGRPIGNTQMYVLDGAREPVPMGVTGEIYIGGCGVARGYLGRPELTAERFIRDPFSPDPEARLYKTGDLGRWTTHGTLEYLGRNDHQVKLRGYRIEMGEIESQLARHTQVKEAVVIAREDVPGDKRLVAYVTARDQGPPNAEELRAHLKALLPEYMVPSAFVVLPSLPLSANGKLERRALPAPEVSDYASRQYEAPQGEVEEALAGIWQELLHIDRVGRHDNFFELGGHSLYIMKLSTRIESLFSVRVSVPAVFKHPNIVQMAQLIESLWMTEDRPRAEQGMEIEAGVI